MNTTQEKEYDIKIDAEGIQSLFKIVTMIQEMNIEAEWAINYLIAYDEIRDQIKEDIID